MKKTFKVLTLMIVAAITAMNISCTKEQDLSGYMTREEFQQWQNDHNSEPAPDPVQLITVKTFSITMPAINDEWTSTATYSGLQGSFTNNDVLLIYFNTGLGGWVMLPFTYGNASYIFANNNGTLTFTKSLALRSTAEAETFSARAFIIPQKIYTEKCKSGVNHNSYDEVVNAYGIVSAE